MAMVVNIIGLESDDDTYQKMRDVYYACDKANIEPPEEVLEYFNFEPPKDEPPQIDISECITKRDVEYTDSWEICVSKIPVTTSFIRIDISY